MLGTMSLRFARVRALLEQGIADGRHPGAQVYVSQRGETLASFAVGLARPGEHLPMNRDTLVPWFSAGKPLTAIGIAQQWEQGQLDLDAPVAETIPEFAQRGKENITVRHLLTHTGGIRSAPYRYPQDDWKTIIQAICAAGPEPRWEPGEKAGYHIATSWFILGEIIRRLTGQGICQYLRKHIFEPIGMTDSWVGMSHEQYEAYEGRIAVMLKTDRVPPQPQEWHEEASMTHCNPGAAAHGPAWQLGRFYEMLLAGGEWEGQRIVTPETVDEFTRRHRESMYDHTFKHVMDWGLGFIIDSKRHGEPAPYGYGPHASENTFGHGGNQASIGMADPDHDLVVAIVCTGMPGQRKHQQRMESLLAAVYEELGIAG